MGRKFIVGGNWKMNGDKNQINEIVNNLKKGPLDPNAEASPFKILLKFNIVAVTKIKKKKQYVGIYYLSN